MKLHEITDKMGDVFQTEDNDTYVYHHKMRRLEDEDGKPKNNTDHSEILSEFEFYIDNTIEVLKCGGKLKIKL